MFPTRILEIFNDLSAVPRGSGNMEQISEYCVDFAKKHSLKYVKDELKNVIIYKEGTKGYENSDPVILQGHLDMVCQKTEDCEKDFLKDGIDVYFDGDVLCAKGTTLGADNGIAVAMIMSILESNDIPHPPIEAVFTTDEEIGMYGALALDGSLFKAKKMINLDGEEQDTVIVSCAGGTDIKATVKVTRETKKGTLVAVALKGLKGGHSGVEINSGRINSNILAGRFLNYMRDVADFDIISVNGGDKSNAIPNSTEIKLCVYNKEDFVLKANECLDVIKNEMSDREPDFSPVVTMGEEKEYKVFSKELKEKIIYVVSSAFNGVMTFSVNIDGLVETSLNFGIFKTEEESLTILFSLRSSKETAMEALKRKLTTFLSLVTDDIESSGYYPPWEYKQDSSLRELYKKTYKDSFGEEPKVEAIHAGLECGVFSSKIKGLDCISIGPDMWEVHTVNERLSVSSAIRTFNLLCELLEHCK